VVSLQNMAATPVSLEVAGKVYKLAPLTLSQYAELEKWAKLAPFRDLRARLDAVGDSIPPEIRADWAKEAATASKDRGAIAQAMNSLEGLQFVFRQCLRAGTPGVTDAEIDSVLSIQGLQALEKVVNELTESGVAKKSDPPAGADAPPKTGL